MAAATPTHYDFLVYGAKGFFGTSVVKAMEDAKKSYVIGKARLEDRAAIAAELDLYTPKYVVSAAGLAGNPNIVRHLTPLTLPKPQKTVNERTSSNRSASTSFLHLY